MVCGLAESIMERGRLNTRGAACRRAGSIQDTEFGLETGVVIHGSGRAQTSGGVKAKFALPVPTFPFTSSSRTWARPWHRRRRRGRAPGSAPSTPDGGCGGRGAGDGAKRSSGRGRRRLPARPRARGGSCRRWPAGWRIRVAATAGRAPAIAAEMAVDCGMAVAAAEVVAVTAVAAVEVAVAAAAATAGAVARQ